MTKIVRNKYPEDFKKSSVKLSLETKQPIKQTAKELGINESTLHTWIRRYSQFKAEIWDMKNKECEDVAKLKKELAKVTQERDLLKKAAAYFAKESM